MDTGAWGATVHRVAWLKHLSTHTCRVLLFLASMVHPKELTTQTLAGYTVWCTTLRAQGRQRHAFHLLRECSVAEFIGLFTLDWSSNCPSWTYLKFVLVPSGCLTNTLGSLKRQKFTVSQFWRLEVQSQDVSRAMLPLNSGGESLSAFCWLLVIGPWCSDILPCSDTTQSLPLDVASSSCDHLRLLFLKGVCLFFLILFIIIIIWPHHVAWGP